MRLFINGMWFLYELCIKRMSKGTVIKRFCSKMGLAYIKFAQILAMQNIEGIFTEEDRRDIMSICDDCNSLSFKEIYKVLVKEYGREYIANNFKKISRKPIGSASISQVHRVILKSGEQAVLKVKRNDVVKTLNKDIKTIRILACRFGFIFGIHNKSASNAVFDYFKEWLLQETDFRNEIYNIERYQSFADSVNGKVSGCVNIVLPKVYRKYCTKNVICMEYIPHQTIFHLDDDDSRITAAFNSYLQLSFYALLHDMPVVWHGDPHGGNVYIDDDGNIGFLDMGLLFEMTPENAKLTRELFMCAYLGLYDRLYDILKGYLKAGQDHAAFKNALKNYCEQRSEKPISSFFMDMVFICFDFDFKPPRFLFEMAKAFVCLSGADGIYNNDVTGFDLLRQQVDEFLFSYCKDQMLKQAHNCLNEVLSILSGNPPNISDFLRKGSRFLSIMKYGQASHVRTQHMI